MPIKDLTTNTDFGAGFPRIATLYKGDAKPADGKRPGRDLKHFRVEFEAQFADLRAVWDDLYEREPTEFENVFVAQPTVDEAFSTWMEEWTATTMLHRCDGEEQHAWWSADNNIYMRARIRCAADNDAPCQCRRIGRLNLILPDFVEAAGVLGYVTMSTHSVHDIITIHRYLTDLERLYGQLTGIPFTFGRRDQKISYPDGKGGRKPQTKSLLYIHVAPEFTKGALLPMLANRTAPALPAGDRKALAETGRRLLGNGGPRRLGVDDAPPEVAEDVPHEASVWEPLGPAWSEKDSQLFIIRWRKQGLTDSDLRDALGVERWGEWTGTADEADLVTNAWLEQQLPLEAE